MLKLIVITILTGLIINDVINSDVPNVLAKMGLLACYIYVLIRTYNQNE